MAYKDRSKAPTQYSYSQDSHLKRNLSRLRLINGHGCEWCLANYDTARHILFACEATAKLGLRHVGHYFMGPSDYHEAPIRTVLRFVRSDSGIIEKGVHNRSETSQSKGRIISAHSLYTYVHSNSRVVLWSEFLTNPEVPGSIPGAF
jgi:hypothetical protein